MSQEANKEKTKATNNNSNSKVNNNRFGESLYKNQLYEKKLQKELEKIDEKSSKRIQDLEYQIYQFDTECYYKNKERFKTESSQKRVEQKKYIETQFKKELDENKNFKIADILAPTTGCKFKENLINNLIKKNLLSSVKSPPSLKKSNKFRINTRQTVTGSIVFLDKNNLNAYCTQSFNSYFLNEKNPNKLPIINENIEHNVRLSSNLSKSMNAINHIANANANSVINKTSTNSNSHAKEGFMGSRDIVYSINVHKSNGKLSNDYNEHVNSSDNLNESTSLPFLSQSFRMTSTPITKIIPLQSSKYKSLQPNLGQQRPRQILKINALKDKRFLDLVDTLKDVSFVKDD